MQSFIPASRATASQITYGSGSVADALAALSPPEGPAFVIDEMTRGSREPYTRFPLLPAGVAEVQEGDIVVNALPVIKSNAYPDVSANAAAGLTFVFKDGVGRDETNSVVDFTFTTAGPAVPMLDRIAELNAALAAAGIALVVVAQQDSFDVVAVYGKWSGVQDLGGEGRARISGTMADELGLTGDLMPRRTAYMDQVTFNSVRFNGGYRSWSKVSILADSGLNGGFFTNGQLFLPDTDHAWITFGVVIDRPGVPGEFDVVVRNATLIGTATTPNMLTTFADPVREYIDPRGLTFVSAP